MRHPDSSTVWVNPHGAHRCVDSAHEKACIHGIPLPWNCEQCAIDWLKYATHNGGL
jgi:hypothetical protein